MFIYLPYVYNISQIIISFHNATKLIQNLNMKNKKKYLQSLIIFPLSKLYIHKQKFLCTQNSTGTE